MDLLCIPDVVNKSEFVKSSNLKVCERNFDGASCWPETLGNNVAVIKCFGEWNGICYDDTRE